MALCMEAFTDTLPMLWMVFKIQIIMDPDTLDNIILSLNFQDLLMVVYLSNLVETQLNLNEKLTLIAQTHP